MGSRIEHLGHHEPHVPDFVKKLGIAAGAIALGATIAHGVIRENGSNESDLSAAAAPETPTTLVVSAPAITLFESGHGLPTSPTEVIGTPSHPDVVSQSITRTPTTQS